MFLFQLPEDQLNIKYIKFITEEDILNKKPQKWRLNNIVSDKVQAAFTFCEPQGKN